MNSSVIPALRLSWRWDSKEWQYGPPSRPALRFSSRICFITTHMSQPRHAMQLLNMRARTVIAGSSRR
eukprot:5143018-Pleurochrysis_carterae.AAC.1